MHFFKDLKKREQIVFLALSGIVIRRQYFPLPPSIFEELCTHHTPKKNLLELGI